MSKDYSDIIDIDWNPAGHARMSREDRAREFQPYDTLSAHGEMFKDGNGKQLSINIPEQELSDDNEQNKQ